MSEPASVVKSESVKENFASRRICDDCAEHLWEAKLIQSSLVPTQGLRHKSFDIAFRFIPFSDVGGDFADFFRLPDGFIGIYLGDVVGKGLPAAMYGALVMGILRGLHKSGTDTAHVLAQLNQRLMQRPIGGRFCSTLYALFNPAMRELIFSNAGMPMPLLVSGSVCRQVGEGGLPLGMFPWATYERHVVQFVPGDCLLFATDGLHESCNREGVEFCTSEMEKVWAQCQRKSATESLDFVFDRELAFSDGNPPHDDIAAVVLKILP
jgi:sigma-B regulation protein RsbU (phosphoserine phosphatase)